MTGIAGVDCSNYTAVPTQQQLNDLWDVGIRFVIIGCQVEAIARQQLTAWANDGRFHLETYQYPYYDNDEYQRMSRLTRLSQEFGVKRGWIDVEWNAPDGPMPTVPVVLNGLRDWSNSIQASGFAAGIYTSSYFWPLMTGNSVEFAGLPLWHAQYYFDHRAGNFDGWKPYGGWTRPLIWQYDGSQDLASLNVDLNAAEDIFWEQEGEPLTDDERRELEEWRAATSLAAAIFDRRRYRVQPAGTNGIGERVVRVVQADGSDPNPSVIVSLKDS